MRFLSWLKAILLIYNAPLAEVFSGFASITWGAATFAQAPGSDVFSARWSIWLCSGIAIIVGAAQLLSVFLKSKLLRSWAAFQMVLLWLAWLFMYANAYLYLTATICFDMFLLNVCCYLSNRDRSNGLSR